MGDFTDKLALGTSRVNPSSMVPGAMGGNAPQNGVGTQAAADQNAQKKALLQQLGNGLASGMTEAVRNGVTNPARSFAQGANASTPRLQMPNNAAVSKRADELHANTPTPQNMSNLPPELQQMLPNKSEKSKTYKKEDFGLLADVFKTLSDR